MAPGRFAATVAVALAAAALLAVQAVDPGTGEGVLYAGTLESQQYIDAAWREHYDIGNISACADAYLEDAALRADLVGEDVQSMYKALGVSSPVIAHGKAAITTFWDNTRQKLHMETFQLFEETPLVVDDPLVEDDETVVISGRFSAKGPGGGLIGGQVLSNVWVRHEDDWKIKSTMLRIDVAVKAVPADPAVAQAPALAAALAPALASAKPAAKAVKAVTAAEITAAEKSIAAVTKELFAVKPKVVAPQLPAPPPVQASPKQTTSLSPSLRPSPTGTEQAEVGAQPLAEQLDNATPADVPGSHNSGGFYALLLLLLCSCGSCAFLYERRRVKIARSIDCCDQMLG